MKRRILQLMNLILCLMELAAGILLLIDPAGFTSVLVMGAGCLLMLLGLWQAIRYFAIKPLEAAKGRWLFRGLCALLFGAFAVWKVEWILSVFPVLTTLYGVGVLLLGLGRIQWTVDMIRLKHKRWYWPAMGALLALAVAALILLDPFGAAEGMWIFTGIALIIEAIVDLLTLIFDWRWQRQEAAEAKAETKEKTKEKTTDAIPAASQDAAGEISQETHETTNAETVAATGNEEVPEAPPSPH